MNKLYNLGAYKPESLNLGTINFIGGDNQELSHMRVCEDILKRIPCKVSEITHETENISTEMLKELKAIIDKEVSNHRKALKKLACKSCVATELAYEIEGFISDETFDSIVLFDNKKVYGKRNVINYLLRRRKSMIRREHIFYEISKGDNMNEKDEYIIKEIKDITGKVIDHDILIHCRTPRLKNGALKERDYLVLHNSERLFIQYEDKYFSTKSLKGIKDEAHFLSVLSTLDCLKVLLPTGSHRVNSGTHLVDASTLTRFVFVMDDAKNGKALAFLRNHRGSKTEFSPVGPWSNEDHWKIEKQDLVGFNYVDYSSNHTVLVGTSKAIETFEGLLNHINEKYGDYYNFTEQTLRPYRESFVGRVSQSKYQIVDENGLLRYENREEPREFRNIDGKVVGSTIVPKEEKELKKYLRSFDKPGAPIVTPEEVKELIEIAEEQDGRQTLLNLEHDIRYELRHLRTRSSSELYYLLKGIHEELYIPNMKYMSEDEVEAYMSDTKQKIIHKKHQALINVLESFKNTQGIHEEEGKGLTSDIKDLVVKEKDGFKANRKSKNLYSQQLGLLKRNQNPQDMTFVEVDKEALGLLQAINRIAIDKRRSSEKENLLTKIVKDGNGNYTKILDVEASKQAGLLQGGYSNIPTPWAKRGEKPQYNDVPEKEYHHSSSTKYQGKVAIGFTEYQMFRKIEEVLQPTVAEEKGVPAPKPHFTKESKNPFALIDKMEDIMNMYFQDKMNKAVSSFSKETKVQVKITGLTFTLKDALQGCIPESATLLGKTVFRNTGLVKTNTAERIRYEYMPKNQIHVDYPLDEFGECVDIKEFPKHVDHLFKHPYAGKNLGAGVSIETTSPIEVKTPSIKLIDDNSVLGRTTDEGIFINVGNHLKYDNPVIRIRGTLIHELSHWIRRRVRKSYNKNVEEAIAIKNTEMYLASKGIQLLPHQKERLALFSSKIREGLQEEAVNIGIQILSRFNIDFMAERIIKEYQKEHPSVSFSSNYSIISEKDGIYKIYIKGFPGVFYAKGNLEALNKPSVSFAGTRKPQNETIQFVEKVVKDLCKDYVIVSGLALGCDTIAHETCLNNNGVTIAVLPSGINNIVPFSNKKLAQRILDNNGLLLSEYPPETKSTFFVERNKWIAGLSKTVVICEAGKGTLHTARFANEQNKNVLVQYINTFNNNSLIELGNRCYYREWVI